MEFQELQDYRDNQEIKEKMDFKENLVHMDKKCVFPLYS